MFNAELVFPENYPDQPPQMKFVQVCETATQGLRIVWAAGPKGRKRDTNTSESK